MPKVYYNTPRHAIRFGNDDGEMQTYSLNAIRAFMYHILEAEKLTIDEYLGSMGKNPYFLLAATGLGKTVAAPVHSYLRHCEDVLAHVPLGRPLFNKSLPRIWIIEPKISIAVSQAQFMNSLFEEFILSRNNPNDPKHPTLFGCKTSAITQNYHSPIKFVTTGIFAIYARLGYFFPGRDCVIIDESHVTIESSEGMELGIAICRNQGIPIHYMSATVDKADLQQTLKVSNIVEADKQRFPVWMHNTGQSMETCIVDLIENTLIHPNPFSSYFPQGNDNVSKQIRQAVLEKGRAKGFLIIVNSFAGEDSDANTVAELLRNAPFAKDLNILLLASAVIRDAKSKKAFDAELARIEAKRELYSIIATSVVEMGVTFPTLDFVATMDSGYDQILIGDVALPEIEPLPVNSLRQRIGRVGRKRAGIGYITNEVGAYYSQLPDEELNGKLQYEPIRLPLKKGSLLQVAFYSLRHHWQDPVQALKELDLPSGIHNDPERVNEFLRQRQRLNNIGIAVDNGLTEEGLYCERWLDVNVDLSYAIKLQESLGEREALDMLFYLAACALSNVSLSSLTDRDETIKLSEFEPGTDFHTNPGWVRTRKGIVLRGEEIEFTQQSELMALYHITRYLTNTYGNILFSSGKSSLERKFFRQAFRQDCHALGLTPDRVEALLQGFAEVLRTFVDTNWKRDDFKELFGEVKSLKLGDMQFPELTEYDIRRFMAEALSLPGKTTIILEKQQTGFAWKEEDADRTGFIRPENTCVSLADKQILNVKLIPLPGNDTRKAGEAWRIVHVQHVQEMEK